MFGSDDESTVNFPYFFTYIPGNAALTFPEVKWSEVKCFVAMYEGHLESKERFAIKKYLLIIGKKQNMQVFSHTFTYFST